MALIGQIVLKIFLKIADRHSTDKGFDTSIGATLRGNPILAFVKLMTWKETHLTGYLAKTHVNIKGEPSTQVG